MEIKAPQRQGLEFITHGKRRFGVLGGDAVIEHELVEVDPSAPTGPTPTAYTFLRRNGDSKMEYCVRFPSGAVQILATEP